MTPKPDERAAFEDALDAASHVCTCVDDDRCVECIYAQERAGVLAIFDAILAERDDLARNARRFYRADGSFEEMEPHEVVRRRIAAAVERDDLARKIQSLDELCTRRPALADLPTLFTKVEKAITVAGTADALARKLAEAQAAIEYARKVDEERLSTWAAEADTLRARLADAERERIFYKDALSPITRDAERLEAEATTLRAQVERLRGIESAARVLSDTDVMHYLDTDEPTAGCTYAPKAVEP